MRCTDAPQSKRTLHLSAFDFFGSQSPLSNHPACNGTDCDIIFMYHYPIVVSLDVYTVDRSRQQYKM
jgi:hypothetical protein